MDTEKTKNPNKENKGAKQLENLHRILWILLALIGLGVIIWITATYFTNRALAIFYILTEFTVFLLFLTHYIRKSWFRSNKPSLDSLTQFEEDFTKSDSKLEYLYKRVDASYRQFKETTSWTYRNVRFYKYSVTILSALATIILGLSYGFLVEEVQIIKMTKLSKDIALIINTLITALTTLSVFWNMEKYWMQNKVIKQQLKILKYEIGFEMVKANKGQIKEELVNGFLKSYLRILRDFHLYWEGALSDRSE